MRILLGSTIPEEIWSHNLLHMPRFVVDSYRQSLSNHSLMELALSIKQDKGPIGGHNKDETLNHFAKRYGVSVCRVGSLVIDPKCAFASIPDDLLTTFSDGQVSVLDAPCGAGAAGTSLVSTIAVLRTANIIPKLPLTITITGGDYSQYALDMYAEMLSSLDATFKSVGIEVTLHLKLWDATKTNQTADLVDNWFYNSTNTEEYLAVIANFSGEAGKSFAKFSRSFEHLFERLHNKPSSVLWVEPSMPGARKFLQRFINAFREKISWFNPSEEIPYECDYTWFHPFQERCLPCRVLVQKYVRN